MRLTGEGYIVQSIDHKITLCGSSSMHSSAYLARTECVERGDHFPIICSTEKTAKNAVISLMDSSPRRYEQVIDILRDNSMLKESEFFSKETDRKLFSEYFGVYKVCWELKTDAMKCEVEAETDLFSRMQ